MTEKEKQKPVVMRQKIFVEQTFTVSGISSVSADQVRGQPDPPLLNFHRRLRNKYVAPHG